MKNLNTPKAKDITETDAVAKIQPLDFLQVLF